MFEIWVSLFFPIFLSFWMSENEWMSMHRASLCFWILGNSVTFRILFFGFIILLWAFISYPCGIWPLLFGDQEISSNFLFSCWSYYTFHRKFLQSIFCMPMDNLLIAQRSGQITLIVTGRSSQRSHSTEPSEDILFLIYFENQGSNNSWTS